MKRKDYEELQRKTAAFREKKDLRSGWIVWCDDKPVFWTEKDLTKPGCRPDCLGVDKYGRIMRAVRIAKTADGLADAWISEGIEE